MNDEVLAKFPPIAIWTAEFDFLRKDAEKFAERAKNAGKLVDIGIMPGVGHGYM